VQRLHGTAEFSFIGSVILLTANYSGCNIQLSFQGYTEKAGTENAVIDNVMPFRSSFAHEGHLGQVFQSPIKLTLISD